MKLAIVDLCGRFCVDPSKATALYVALGAALKGGVSVVLDFSGVGVLTSAFLNSAIGGLYGAFPAETIDQQLSFTGLDDTDHSLVQAVQSNARRFYALSPEQRTRLIESESHLVENGN